MGMQSGDWKIKTERPQGWEGPPIHIPSAPHLPTARRRKYPREVPSQEAVKEQAEGRLVSSLLPSAGLDLNKHILLHDSGPGLPQPEIRGIQRKRRREGTSD